MHNLEDISSNISDHNVLIPSQLVPNLYAQDVPMDDAPIANQEEPDCLDNGSNVQGDTQSWHTDMYPGAAHTYCPGTTFMDKFDCDEHANQHTIFTTHFCHGQTGNLEHGYCTLTLA